MHKWRVPALEGYVSLNSNRIIKQRIFIFSDFGATHPLRHSAKLFLMRPHLHKGAKNGPASLIWLGYQIAAEVYTSVSGPEKPVEWSG